MHLGLRRSATFQPQLFAHLLLLFITCCFGNSSKLPLSKRFLSTSRLLLNDHHHHNCSTSADCASEELQKNEGNSNYHHQHFNRHCIAGKCRCPFGFISHHFATSHSVNRKNQGLYFCHPYRCYHNFECQREIDRWTRCALERHQCICLPEAVFNSTTQSCEVAGMMKMLMLMRMTKVNDENNNVTFSQLLSSTDRSYFRRKTNTKNQQKSHWWLLVLTVPLALLVLLYIGHKAFLLVVRNFGGGRISNTTANSSSITTNINGSAASSASRFYATFHRCSATSSNDLP